jgi:hypothetical protein
MFKLFSLLVICNALTALPLLAQQDVQGDLLDKIALILNEQNYTLSDLDDIKKNAASRAEIAPNLYEISDIKYEDVAEILTRIYIVRSKLKEIGYSVTDDVVEDRIKYIEKAQGLTRDDLVRFLKNKNLGYEQYFELIKQSIEQTQYMQKLIYPTVEVSDQELTSTFLKYNPALNTKSIKYSITVINLPVGFDKVYSLKEVITHLKNFQSGTPLPTALSDIKTESLTSVDESSLSKQMSNVLKQTETNEFSQLTVINKIPTLFFINGREITNSSLFDQQKESLKQQLTFLKAKNLLNSWIDQEKKNFYISVNL